MLRSEIEHVKMEKTAVEEQLVEVQQILVNTQEAHRALQEHYRKEQEQWDGRNGIGGEMEELGNEEESGKMLNGGVEEDLEINGASLPEKLSDMAEEIRVLRDKNTREEILKSYFYFAVYQKL